MELTNKQFYDVIELAYKAGHAEIDIKEVKQQIKKLVDESISKN